LKEYDLYTKVIHDEIVNCLSQILVIARKT